jgi:hypothetical protein
MYVHRCKIDKSHGSKNVRETGFEDVNLIHLAQDREQQQVLTNIQVP